MTLADDSAIPAAGGNAEPYSVTELAFALKRTLEDAYGFVRVRAELSKITRHASGHIYLTLKDDKAAIDGVVWKGQVRALHCQPEQGLEVIVTGRITTYPASSKYQIVVETMEAAGVGALLAQLERLKAKLQAEGLFEAARKRGLPFTPAVIGVITSPTGAVIRDILHRIRDRWPCHVMVWPVVVQGDQAAAQVRAAIAGFNAMTPGGDLPRPDILIVARGGGSVEDLWPFNDEALARAAAASAIPLISAVGHETDTTLIDFVSDRRAPTPTAAAEMATPVLGEFRAALADYERRLARCGVRTLQERRVRLDHAARGLPRPLDVLALASQRYDLVAGRLTAALDRNASLHDRALTATAARLNPALLSRPRQLKADQLAGVALRLAASGRRSSDLAERRARLPERGQRLAAAMARRMTDGAARLEGLDKLRLSLDPDRPLHQGFARVQREDGTLARRAGELTQGEAVSLVFGDGVRKAVVDGARSGGRRKGPDGLQGDLF